MVYIYVIKKTMFMCPKSACWLKMKPYDIFGRVRIQYPMDWENISWLHDPSVSFTRAYHVCSADEWCLRSIQHVIDEKKSLFQVQLGTVDLSTASVDQFFETKGWNGMTPPKFRKLGMYGFLWLPILIYIYIHVIYLLFLVILAAYFGALSTSDNRMDDSSENRQRNEGPPTGPATTGFNTEWAT